MILRRAERVLKIIKIKNARPVTPPDQIITVANIETPTTARGVRKLLKSLHQASADSPSYEKSGSGS